MANGIYNRTKYLLATGVNLATADLRVLLVSSSYSFNSDHNFVSDVVSNEISVAGYSRQVMASKTVTEDDATDVAYLDGEDVTFADLAIGQTVGGAILYRHNASDTAAEVLAFYDVVDTPTNGGDIIIQWSAPPNGALKLA